MKQATDLFPLIDTNVELEKELVTLQIEYGTHLIKLMKDQDLKKNSGMPLDSEDDFNRGYAAARFSLITELVTGIDANKEDNDIIQTNIEKSEPPESLVVFDTPCTK